MKQWSVSKLKKKKIKKKIKRKKKKKERRKERTEKKRKKWKLKEKRQKKGNANCQEKYIFFEKLSLGIVNISFLKAKFVFFN